jgi:hypothetical protein
MQKIQLISGGDMLETCKIKIGVVILSIVAMALIFSSLSFGSEPTLQSSLRKISNLIFESIRKSMPRTRDSNYQVTAAMGVRGFGASEPYEKSVFRLGALSAELRYAEGIPDEKNSQKIVSLIVEGLNRLNIEIPNAQGAMSHSQLNPVMEKLANEKNIDAFFQLGQWVEAMRLVMITARDGHPDIAYAFLGTDNQAGYFIEALKGKDVHHGVINNLRKLDKMKGKDNFSDHDIKKAIACLENILLLLE